MGPGGWVGSSQNCHLLPEPVPHPRMQGLWIGVNVFSGWPVWGQEGAHVYWHLVRGKVLGLAVKGEALSDPQGPSDPCRVSTAVLQVGVEVRSVPAGGRQSLLRPPG